MLDTKIIGLFFERSEQAIQELDRKYGNLFHKISMNILNSRLDAEECVNDSYLGAWNTIPPQKPDPLLAYVCKIVRNISLSRYYINTALKRNSAYDVAMEENVSVRLTRIRKQMRDYLMEREVLYSLMMTGNRRHTVHFL